MTFQEGFDYSSATRCADGVSAINKSNDSLEEQKNINIDDAENDMSKSTCSSSVTITPISTDGKNTSSNEKFLQLNDKTLHESQDDDEARAFRSQFDEIKCASRMLEYSKNNTYNRFQGPAGRVPSAPLQKRINETSFHQRSHSHSTHPQQTSRQMLKHQRSISSIQGLSFNGNKFYSTGLPSTPSTPFTPYGFDNDEIFSPLRHPLHHFDDSNSVNGNDDTLMKFRDLENCGGRFGFNNSRFADEWDDSSPGYPSTPLSNGPFTPLPLTPSSTYSSLSPSTPYFAQPHSLLDDDELFEKAKRLEEERILLQIQQRKLDNAIAAHKLRYQNSDPSLDETEARYKSNNTTPPLMPTRGKTIPFTYSNKFTAPPPRFQNSQEPIGTPIKKSGYITPPSTTPTNSSFSTSAPTFSLFSNPPALSLNHNLMNQQQKHHRTISSDNYSFSFNGEFSPLNGYPLTPSNSPPKTNNNDGYFSFNSYTNASSANNKWVNNSENNYYKPSTPTVSTPGYFRAPLYSTPVYEREEDSLFADGCFNRKGYENNFNCSFIMDDRNLVD
ncbi:hypothetical protein C1645_738279 [Glomus cerebriforme]|uniref:Uncharacterized protein n=1 Tax=Glomus cerebriforme TaxID=658196 RepID=A0A397SV36_9GLOM|nr:hypothetical protein C1645_738279 [Glomus cerebriforme]